MKRALVALIILMSITTSSFAQTWYRYGGHLYARTISTDYSWAEAVQDAISHRGQLVAIGDVHEDDWLKSTFGSTWFWIDFTDQLSEGDWRWSSGVSVTYTNWNFGEPNNQGGAENWAGMVWPQNPGWNDFPVWYRMPGVIEVAPLVVAEPSTGWLLAFIVVAFVVKRKRHRH